MGSMENPLSFHLFGNVWLEDPRRFLKDEQYRRLLELMPRINDMESKWQNRASTDWNMASAFAELCDQDVAAWYNLGVQRPAHFITSPSGSINSPIACHLINPTFRCATPFAQQTFDPTNSTMNLLSEGGFTPQNCFIFDQYHRRENTRNLIQYWNDDVKKPHHDFVRELRKNMRAVVEICWGEYVWTTMQEMFPMIPFPLWGKWKDIKLYLELSEDQQTVKRFVFFVYHPQHFRFNRNGIERWMLRAKFQDLSLSFAGELVGMNAVNQNYYQSHYQRGLNPPLTAEQFKACRELSTSARTELLAAFPEQAERIKNSLPRAQKRAKENEMLLRLVEKEVTVMEKPLSRVVTEIEHLDLWRLHDANVQKVAHAWIAIHADIMASYAQSPIFFNLPLKEDHLDMLDEWESFGDFDLVHLPQGLFIWLQTQKGLCIDGRMIENREDLERVFQLLYCQEEKLQLGSIRHASVGELALAVGVAYISGICRKKKEVVIRETIPADQVIRRKCSLCKRRVLDDAFPRFSKKDPKSYILKSRVHQGCGLTGCKGSVHFLPNNTWQPYLTITAAKSADAMIPKRRGRGDFTTILCRSEEQQLGDLPRDLCVKCNDCGYEKIDMHPRWTIENPARYVVPKGICHGCGKQYAYFKPAVECPTVSQATLSNIWHGFQKVGCNLSEVLVSPDIVFGKGSYDTKARALQRLAE